MTLPLSQDRNFIPDDVSVGQSAVYYNGFKFPPAIRATASLEPVMDSSGRITKYNKFKLKISFYLFYGLSDADTGSSPVITETNNVWSSGYSRQSNFPTGIKDHTKTTDLEVMNLRRRLTEAGQHLLFKDQGFGTFNINDPAFVTGFVTDVDNGPKPKVVTWRPLSNKMCFIEWEVETNFSPCVNSSGDPTSPIAEFSSDLSLSINRAGLSVRRITGKMEIPLNRIPSADQLADPHAGVSANYDFSFFQQTVISVFPMLRRFWREQEYNLSNDRKWVNFTLTDTEINSDEAFGEGCVNEECTLTAASHAKRIFNMFDVTMQGRIELAAGFPKSYAFNEITRLFNKFYTTNSVLGSKLLLRSASAVEQTEDSSSNYTDNTQPSTAILDSISFSDEVFGRSVSFSIKWTLFTTLATLFRATGLFTPARDNPDVDIAANIAIQDNAWDAWKGSLGTFLDSGGYSQLSYNQDDDVIVSLCNPLNIGASLPQDSQRLAPEEMAPSPDAKLAADSWLSYDAQFELEVDENTTFHAPLGSYVSSQESATAPNTARANTSYVAPAIPNSPDTDQNTYVHNHRQPTYILHFRGAAVRLNYPVPIPKIEKAYGQVVRRIGTSTIKPRFLGTSTDPTSGQSYKMFGLMWHITYALPAPPADSTLKTDGFKNIYT